jgi:hypothetical protein
MRVWKLTPTNLAAPIWKKWSPEPVIVRAENDSEARLLAQFENCPIFARDTGARDHHQPVGRL